MKASLKWYFYKKKRRYFPDFYIASENLVVEVKSTYTYTCNKEMNKKKAQCVIDAGFKFQFWIVQDDKQTIIIESIA